MVSALDSGSSCPGLGPGWGHCVVFLGKTLYSHSHGASLYSGALLGIGEFNPAMDWHPIQGGVEILLVASCYRNRDNLQPNGPLGS